MSGSLGMSRSPADAAKATAALADHFGGIDTLRDASAEAIMKWQLSAPFGYGAVQDGAVISEPIENAIGDGRYTNGMPLLIGTCEHESALWTAMGGSTGELDDAARLEQLSDDDLVKLALGLQRDPRPGAVARDRSSGRPSGRSSSGDLRIYIYIYI